MKILHLVHVRWWNAAAQYAIHLAQAQREAGHDVTVFTAPGEPPATHAKSLAVPVFERSLAPWHLPAIIADLRRLGKDADVVNAHQADLQVAALIAFPQAKRPLIIRTRVDVRAAKGGAVTRFLYNRFIDGIIVPGEESKTRYVRDMGIEAARVHVVYGGIDTTRFRPGHERGARVRAELGIPPERTVFGFVGRLEPVKAPEVFLAAAAELHAKHPDVHFILAGRPVDEISEAGYRELAASHGMERFHFLGQVEDMPALMNAMDAGVITSIASEAHCRVGLEMMSSGIPVIGTEIGVIPEVVKQGETGYIVRSREMAELASAMERLASDTAARQRLGVEARRQIEAHHSYHAWVTATAAAYQNARLQTERAEKAVE